MTLILNVWTATPLAFFAFLGVIATVLATVELGMRRTDPK